MADPYCQWREEDEDGNGIPGTECGRPAHWRSCVPFIGSPTCDGHKCRCAKPLKGMGGFVECSATRRAKQQGKEG